MTLYVKKRIPIEAVRFSNTVGGWKALEAFTDNQVRLEDGENAGSRFFVYDYLHNTWVEFFEGDWILRGLEGEFYPHNGELFPKVYEEYEE